MIAVSVKYAGLPRSDTGLREEIWSVKDGTTLEELLARVAAKYNWHLDDSAQFTIVFKQHGIHRADWSDQTLKDHDPVLILSSIAGG